MASPTSTPDAPKHGNLALHIPDMQKFSTEPLSRYRPVENHEPSRAFSDGDVQHHDAWGHEQRVDLHPNYHPSVQMGSVSSPATYISTDNRTWSLGLRSEAIRDAEQSDYRMPSLQSRLSFPQTEGFFRSATINNEPNIQAQSHVLSRAVTAPAAAPTQWQPFAFQKVAYCPRCLFWLDPKWAQNESMTKKVDLVDPHGHDLDRKGLDRDGHLRLNDRCCFICDVERYLIKNSPHSRKEEFVTKPLDQILADWTHRGIVKGMSREEMDLKESIMPIEEHRSSLKANQDALAASGAHKLKKKHKDLGLPPGVWGALELGFELTAEALKIL